MSLINYNKRIPWNKPAFSTLLSADDFFNDDFFSKDSLMPAMNVAEHKKGFEIELAAPGFSKKDFNVTIDDNGLHISAEKDIKTEAKKEGYLCKEFSYNSFKRSMKLPENINLNKKVKANYRDGILKFNLLKKNEAKASPKKVIEVM